MSLEIKRLKEVINEIGSASRQLGRCEDDSKERIELGIQLGKLFDEADKLLQAISEGSSNG